MVLDITAPARDINSLLSSSTANVLHVQLATNRASDYVYLVACVTRFQAPGGGGGLIKVTQSPKQHGPFPYRDLVHIMSLLLSHCLFAWSLSPSSALNFVMPHAPETDSFQISS